MKRIAIYGKGGIGKSTTVANISTALAQEGVRVMQIGCDPKADSTIALTNGVQIPTVLDMLRANGENTTLSDITHEGSCGVICVESGGPKPGSGCAGRGIISALEKLEELNAYEIYQPDIVLYDVLGDVVCGGFAMPIRKGYADLVYVVTSGERMSLFAAGNIIEAVRSFGARGYAGLGGIIVNKKGFDNEFELVKNIAAELNVEIVFEIERDGIVQDAESLNKTVVEAYPDSAQAKRYQMLARELYTRVPQEQAVCQS